MASRQIDTEWFGTIWVDDDSADFADYTRHLEGGQCASEGDEGVPVAVHNDYVRSALRNRRFDKFRPKEGR